MNRPLVLIPFLLTSTLSCGAQVSFDDDPGGTGDSPSAGSPPLSACESVCGQLSELGCFDIGSCTSFCEQWASSQCSGALGALADCAMAEGFSSCSPSPACVDEHTAFMDCSATLQLGQCGGEVEGRAFSDCTSIARCDDRVLAANCFIDESEMLFCECTVDGIVMGTCEDYLYDEPPECSVGSACCEFELDFTEGESDQ